MKIIKESLTIFIVDWKRIFKSKSALIIIIGLMLLPSLYAWFNIAALWDPYGNAANLPIDVYSADNGAQIAGESVNVGDELIAGLKENDDLAWQFATSNKQLQQKVETGEYYAAIVIPDNFTDMLVNSAENNFKKPTIEYTVNEKVNAISPKMTEAGADAIYNQIASGINQMVSASVLQLANETGQKLTDNRQLLKDALASLNAANENVDTIDKALNKAEDLSAKLIKLDKKIDDINNQITSRQTQILKDINQAISKLENSEFEQKIEDKYKSAIDSINVYIDQYNQFDRDATVQKLSGLKLKINAYPSSEAITSAIDQMILKLENIPEVDVEPIVNELTSLKSKLEKLPYTQNTVEMIDSAIEKLNNMPKIDVSKAIEKLTQVKAKVAQSDDPSSIIVHIDSAIKRLNNMPAVEHINGFDTSENMTQKVTNKLVKIEATIANIDLSAIDVAHAKVDDGKQVVANLIQFRDNKWQQVKTKINNSSSQANDFSERYDYEQIVDILSTDKESASKFMASPVNLETNRLYPVTTYGTASTPFYTTLCLWVGSLLMASLLAFEYHGQFNYKLSEYFGRMLTFITIAIVQALIVTVGNITIIGVQASNVKLLFAFDVFLAIVFTVIIYTLVSVFGNIGKALGIIGLVLSISGGGGNFPIEVSGPFFNAIYPYLPFTYGVKLLREAIAGVYMPTVVDAVSKLSITAGIFIIFGIIGTLVFKKYFQAFDKASKESHIIH